MAKVKTEVRGFNGRSVRLDYKCGADGIFTCDLPPECNQRLGKRDVAGHTLKECEKAVVDVFEEFMKSRTTKRKVICWQFKATCLLYAPDGGFLLERKDVSFANGTALSLGVAVYEEERVARGTDDRSVEYNYEQQTSNIPKGMGLRMDIRSHRDRPYEFQMDWTEERESFWVQLSENLEGLILRLDNLTNNVNQLSQIADTATATKLIGQ